jgi:hypothetical protein
MKLPRRRFLKLVARAAAVPTMSLIARAQSYPSRPVRWIVPFPPGGGTDIVARLIGQWLSERLGQPFVFGENVGQFSAQEVQPLAHCNAALKRVWCPLASSSSSGAGARPDHPITGQLQFKNGAAQTDIASHIVGRQFVF